MPLINCPDCAAEVSDRAPSCLRCGAPIASAVESKAAGAALTTTQGTSKKLKMQSLLSSILFWLGVALTIGMAQSGNGNEDDMLVPVLMTMIGLVWYLVTKIRIWWHHD